MNSGLLAHKLCLIFGNDLLKDFESIAGLLIAELLYAAFGGMISTRLDCGHFGALTFTINATRGFGIAGVLVMLNHSDAD